MTVTPADVLALMDLGLSAIETARKLWSDVQVDATPEEQAKWRATFEANRSKVGVPKVGE